MAAATDVATESVVNVSPEVAFSARPPPVEVTMALSTYDLIVLVSSFSDIETPIEAPNKPPARDDATTSESTVESSVDVSEISPAAVIRLLFCALEPMIYDSTVLLITFVELAPAPEKLKPIIETAAEIDAATDVASTVEVAEELSVSLPADEMVEPEL